MHRGNYDRKLSTLNAAPEANIDDQEARGMRSIITVALCVTLAGCAYATAPPYNAPSIAPIPELYTLPKTPERAEECRLSGQADRIRECLAET